MLTKIARFEFRYLLRNPLLWVTSVAVFAMFFIATSVPEFELGSEGGLLANAAYATARNYLIVSAFFMFITTSFIANVVVRDDETGYGPIIRSTPITKFQYLIGRFLGAFAMSAICFLLVPLAMVIGSHMPWADPTHLGPTRLFDHLYAYFLLALPNLFIHAAIFFALATITRSMMSTYFGVITFTAGFLLLQGSYTGHPQLQKAVALADPFGSQAMSGAIRYWTIAERNTTLPDFAGLLLYNRLLWVGIAIACLVFACVTYRFADQGMSKRERKKQKLENAAAEETPRFAGAASLPSPAHDSAAMRALVWMRTRFEMKQVIVSPAFAMLLAWGLFTTAFVLITQRDPDGRPRFPTTLLIIPKIEEAFSMIPLVIAIYYAGEVVWRERSRRVHELVDASPLPNWAYVIPKTMAMALVLVSILVINVVAGIILQLSMGYTHLELAKYVLWYVLPAAWDMLLLAALAVFIQSISPHKAVGWAAMMAFLLWKELISKVFNHKLVNYGATPAMPISDINGAGSFWVGPWILRLYWGAFAALLLLAAHLLWRRGTEIRLRPRLANARRRLSGASGLVAAAAIAIFAGTGAFAYYNTNVLNQYRSPKALEAWIANFEKKYWKYHDLPQPTIKDLDLNIAIYPQQRRATIAGKYLLRNETPVAIPDVHVRVLDSDLQLAKLTIAGAQPVMTDPEFRYRIYHLDHPMQPGEARVLTFEAQHWERGFRNSYPNTSLIENGTFMAVDELMPVVGRGGMPRLSDPERRRKYGLAADMKLPKLEDLSTTQYSTLGVGWTKSDITISTSSDQTPIAPGKKVSDVTRRGRRTARFVSQAPILIFFNAQSARYAEKHRMHNGVDLGVYYHPAHPWNVDRMLDALATSLDYYQANFGPYQFDHVRIVEFPGYRYFAQAFAGTIPYSETYGFLSDFRKPETVDGVTGTTAHELAHQYWAHQLIGAATEGSDVLSETLAMYSAMMVLEKLHGEDHIRRFLQYELDYYLAWRAQAGGKEAPLARADEPWIIYRKGSLVMYLLRKRLGEDAVNHALRGLLERYKFKGAPYPRSLDLIAALRAEAKTPEDQALITDLFERVTLYDLKVTQPAAVQRPDGKWDVTVPVEAKKMYGDTPAPLDEHIEVGLFTAEPGVDVFDQKDVILMERQPIHSGSQVLRFVTEIRPLYAGVDPYNYYIDRNSEDNVVAVR